MTNFDNKTVMPGLARVSFKFAERQDTEIRPEQYRRTVC